MMRHQVELPQGSGMDRPMSVISYGHYDSLDGDRWSGKGLPIEERALRHEVYTRWLTHSVVPFIHADTASGAEVITVGCSLGAYHAVHFSLQRADLAPLAIGLSGNYDVTTWGSWGEHGDATYFANPTEYVAILHGDHLDWLRSRLSVLLVVGQGAWRPTRPARCRPLCALLECLPKGRSVVSWICGATTSVTTGSGGSASSLTICHGFVSPDRRGDIEGRGGL